MTNMTRHRADLERLAAKATEVGWLLTPAANMDGGRVLFLFAHGAGAPMDSDFMSDMAGRLAALGVDVLRFEFPYMAQRRMGGGKRPPNPQPQLLETWRQVHAQANECYDGRIAIGGKSMGGRMASLLAGELQAHALICLGYPFHPAGKPQKTRVDHLGALAIATLIVQGERDALGTREQAAGYELSSAIEFLWIPTANHDLRPLKSSGLEEDDARQRAAEAVARVLKYR